MVAVFSVIIASGILVWRLLPDEALPDYSEPIGQDSGIVEWNVYKNHEYGFQLKYPGSICRDLDCAEWDIREEIFNEQPRIVISPKEKESGMAGENSTIRIYPEGLATGLLFISDEYLQKEERSINGFSASVSTYLTEGDKEFQWFVRFIDHPWNWSEYNYVIASVESDLERKCGGLPEEEVEDLDRCVEEQGWTLSGWVNEGDAMIISEIISTIEFIDIDFPGPDMRAGEKPIRWTTYAHFSRLDEIEFLLDEAVKNLAKDLYGDASSFYCQDMGFSRGEETIQVNTCREYRRARESGFNVHPSQEEHVKACFWYPCGYLYFFQKAQPSERSNIGNFDLAEEWTDLPLYDIFGAGQMGMVSREVVDMAEIWESGDYYIQGGYEGALPGYGDNYSWSFELRLLGWGDFNGDGLEDILLWKSDSEYLRRYAGRGYAVISQEDDMFWVEGWYGH